jgi:hypothetical protein
MTFFPRTIQEYILRQDFHYWIAWVFLSLPRLGGVWDSRIVEGGIPLLVGVRCESDDAYPAILLESSLYVRFMTEPYWRTWIQEYADGSIQVLIPMWLGVGISPLLIYGRCFSAIRHSGQRSWPHLMHSSLAHVLLAHEQHQGLIRTRMLLVTILGVFSCFGTVPNSR